MLMGNLTIYSSEIESSYLVAVAAEAMHDLHQDEPYQRALSYGIVLLALHI